MEDTLGCRLLPDFQSRLKMKKGGNVIFSEMLRWEVRLRCIAPDADLLRTYQERFLYILVDEYRGYLR
ncbi:MAG: hypothetical protein IPJ06_16795, partial [Saprospiraceae bacterium]|nr:hypothetical protein [Saprospiraceae bacterium]